MLCHNGHYNTISQYQVPSSTANFAHMFCGFPPSSQTRGTPLLKQDKNPPLYSSSNENVNFNRVAMVVLLHFGEGDPEACSGKMLKTCVV